MSAALIDSLSRGQRRVYDAIIWFRAEYGMSPTIRDLMAMLGIRSPNGVRNHLVNLANKKLLTWTPAVARSILPTEPEKCPHCGKELP